MAQNNLFPIDPVKTDLTAPVSSVQVQSPLDTTLTTTTRSAGIKNFSDAFTKLALKKQANDIHNDTITAQLAEAYNQEMPGGLEPEAQFAYNRAVDLTTKRKVLQQMEDFLAIDGSEILHDDRMDRKTRATSFKNQLLGLLNLGKGSISQANAAEMFSDMDAMFDKVMSKANLSLAKDKKQEVLATTAEAFRSTMNDNLKFMEELAPKVSDTDIHGNELSPAQFAKNQKEFAAGWLAKHINSKWFNAAVKQISRMNTGAEIEDIKATALTIVGDELLKRVAKNPEIVQEKLMADIIANVPGSVKGTTLQDEIDSRSKFGKTVDTINTEFRKNLKSTLDGLETDQKAANTKRDKRLADIVLDALLLNDPEMTEAKANALVAAIENPSEQRPMMTILGKHYSSEGTLSSGHPAWEALIKDADKYVKENGAFDKAAFIAEGYRQRLTTKAITDAIKLADPNEKIAQKRKDLFAHKVIDTSRKRFATTIATMLEEQGFARIVKQMQNSDGSLKMTDMTRAMLKKKLKGDSRAYVMKILNAELMYEGYLERLALSNPDAPITDLVRDAQEFFRSEFTDLLIGLPLGTTHKQDQFDKIKKAQETAPTVGSGTGGAPMSVISPIATIVETQDKPYTHLNLTPKVAGSGATTFASPTEKKISKLHKLHIQKGVLEGNSDAQDVFIRQATADINLQDKVKAEIFESSIKMNALDGNIRKRAYYKELHRWKGIDPRKIYDKEFRNSILPKATRVRLRAEKLKAGTAEPVKTLETRVEEGTGGSHVRQTKDLKVGDKTFTLPEEDVVLKVIEGVKKRVKTQQELDKGTSLIVQKTWKAFGKIFELTGKGLRKAGESLLNLTGLGDDEKKTQIEEIPSEDTAVPRDTISVPTRPNRSKPKDISSVRIKEKSSILSRALTALGGTASKASYIQEIAAEEINSKEFNKFGNSPYIAIEVQKKYGFKNRRLTKKQYDNLPASSIDIGIGHKLTVLEKKTGLIKGLDKTGKDIVVNLFNKQGKLRKITEEEAASIFRVDIKKAEDGAKAVIKSRVKAITFNEFPIALQQFFTDIVYNVGRGKEHLTNPRLSTGFQRFNNTLRLIETLARNKKSKTKMSQSVLNKTVNQFLKEVKDRGGAQHRANRLFDSFKVEEQVKEFFGVNK